MFSKEVLKSIIVANQKYIDSLDIILKRRHLPLPQNFGKVVVFYGVRRSGKTYCLYDIFKTSQNRALYIDFEDERLANFKAIDFQTLKEAFLELYPGEALAEPIFLLDEVQNVAGWEKFARRVSERENVRVFASGSSSKMPPQQLHTSLRGRSWGIEVFPFSFEEYLKSQKVELTDPTWLYDDKNRAAIKKHFLQYLQWGGFPEVCFAESLIDKKKIAQEYLEAIFFKDLVERFKIGNIQLLNVLRDKLFESAALKISLNALYKQYRGQFPFSKDSLFTYYQYFLESLIVFESRIFTPSAYKRQRNPAKVYLIDPGIALKIPSEDLGRQLENVVFLGLKRRENNVFYYENQGECDFIAKAGPGVFNPFQVTWQLGDENRVREVQGLIMACRHLGVKSGTILTLDDEAEEQINGIKINIVPTWKWLLQSQ
ncbi:ATP-binding protein [Candidatus Saganbacteria bacterium]|nr:ATP-binding protein [Candidatus Saganbacteria bacterium]